MCFAPQRRVLFQHLNFQKWSEPLVFCTFWFRNVLRATTACTFSTSQLPKVVRTLQFLTHFTSKYASRHNGVQLFISHLPRCLRTRRFSEPTFQPSGATIPRKNTVLRDFPIFSRTCIFFLLIFSLLTLPSLKIFDECRSLTGLERIKPSLKIFDECGSLTGLGGIKPLLKIFNECRSLTGLEELNPYWRSSMNVEV